MNKPDPFHQKNALPSGGEPADLPSLVEYSHNVARQVLPMLAGHRIPITPSNYRLFYEYFSGGSEMLKATLDQFLGNETEFTTDVTRVLYQRFFSLEATEQFSRLVEQIGTKVQAAAAEFIKGLIVSIAQTSEYSQTLGKHIRKIESAPDLEAVKHIVTAIMTETGVVLKDQGKLQRKMESTSQDMATLQEELKKSEQQAHTDELTGLNNRRAFNLRLAGEISRARRYGTVVSLIMLDLDDFKSVNDRHGHVVGDRLLVTMARTLASAVREPDFPCRYGGEEFAVICPQTDLHGAILLADRLRKGVEMTRFTAKGQSVQVTISAGVALLRENQSMEEFIERADQALYRSKALGKNRVTGESELD